MAKEAKDEIEKVAEAEKSSEKICGIIMPIADTDGYPSNHWGDVLSIVKESVRDAEFTPGLVSEDIAVGSILKRIVQNIYDNPIIVCDISSRNANVMFELGMRLAFDKPTVIIKDDLTPYSFDIQSIETLTYPSDLRYQAIQRFKGDLRDKIKGTYQKSINDNEHTTFLRNFGTFKVATVKEQQVEGYEILQDEMKDIKKMMLNVLGNNNQPLFLGSRKYSPPSGVIKNSEYRYTFELNGMSASDRRFIRTEIAKMEHVAQVNTLDHNLTIILDSEINLRSDDTANVIMKVQNLIDAATLL